jgi:hypothetical protein
MTSSTQWFLVKTSPLSCEIGETISVNERSMYNGHLIRPGDNIVVWFSETKGGKGLAFFGKVQRRHAVSGITTYLDLDILIMSAVEGVTIRDLDPFRDVRDNSPLSQLSAKLYRQSHDKICMISNAEADFLTSAGK